MRIIPTSVRQSMMTALARNKYICEIADQIVFVGVNEKSSLKTFIEQFIGKSIML